MSVIEHITIVFEYMLDFIFNFRNFPLTLLASIITVFSTLIVALVSSYQQNKEQQYRRITQGPYQERLFKLLDNLKKSSDEFDEILHEMSSVAASREEAVRKLEIDLIELENREKEIKDRVDNLKNVPLPVADHLAKLMEPEGKKSARRDYLLFLSGVIVSTAIAVILELYFKT